jgi:hypothetical protein
MEPPMFYRFSRYFKTIFLIILLLGAIGTSYYFYAQNQKTLKLLQNPKVASEEEKKNLIQKVGALMDLPTDEEPSIVTILDQAKVNDQPFFAKAENGDKVLVYSKAQEAIIYRPGTNKIIKVGPIDTSNTDLTSYTVSLSTNSSDLSSLDSIETDLKKKMSNLVFTSRGITKQTDYSKNIVVDVKGDKESVANQIAKNVNATVSTLPAGETKPETDFLVIIAKNLLP